MALMVVLVVAAVLIMALQLELLVEQVLVTLMVLVQEILLPMVGVMMVPKGEDLIMVVQVVEEVLVPQDKLHLQTQKQ